MTFIPTESGTYFINARAFDNIPTDGTSGDLVGDYELFVRHAPADAYQPYYDPSSPLYAIDWGTQVDGTVRNPDGDDGPRPTGNSVETPVQNEFSITGTNVIAIYFARAGDVFVSNDLTNPGLPPAIVAVGAQDFERQAVFTALSQFSAVADIQYVEVDNREDANFFYVTYTGTPGPGVSLLGSMSPPQESDEGLAQFNSGDYRWNATNLAQGGFSFVTLIHEFGHGHGLAHPHDNGGHSGVMNGVESDGVVADYTLGEYDLNQSVFTMMSYEDGWQTSPYGNADTDVGYGYLGSLMAFDVAAIQDAYGVNETYRTGDDVYTLSDVNATGTFYSCIWDAGGTDEIRYVGTRDANIDLRAATLQYEVGGGGWVSYAYGIYGGYTIANAVTIENATGGNGGDHLTGNGVANILSGGLGLDVMDGGAGNDVLIGGLGGDTLIGGDGVDWASYEDNYGAITASLRTGLGYTNAAYGDTYSGIENLRGSMFGDYLTGSFGANTLDGADGDDVLIGSLGADVLTGGDGSDFASYEDNWGAVFIDLLRGGGYGNAAQGDTYRNIENIRGTIFNDYLIGSDGANVLEGGNGNDTLLGALGGDTLIGGFGSDTVSYEDNQGAVFVNLTTGHGQGNAAEGDTYSSVENIIGTAYDDTLAGDEGANVIDGGRGNDLLIGAGGAETFMFSTMFDVSNIDRISDFERGSDRIGLATAQFGMAAGALSASAFANGAATTADQHILYDAASGALSYDSDGNGTAAAVQFAWLTTGRRSAPATSWFSDRKLPGPRAGRAALSQ